MQATLSLSLSLNIILSLSLNIIVSLNIILILSLNIIVYLSFGYRIITEKVGLKSSKVKLYFCDPIVRRFGLVLGTGFELRESPHTTYFSYSLWNKY